MKEYTVLIAKENAEYCRELGELFSKSGCFKLMEPLHDGLEAADSIMNIGPDILLLDTVLPGRDGLSVLQELNRRGIGSMKIIMLSPYVYDGFVEILQTLGVALVMHMPLEPQMVFKRVLDFAVTDKRVKADEMEMRERELAKRRERVISNYFHALGVPVRLMGYRQAKLAIAYCVENYGQRVILLNDVYAHVAAVCATDAKCVERNIRTLIDVTWERGNMEQQHKLFGYTVYLTRGRPTNKEFISMITERTAASLRYR